MSRYLRMVCIGGPFALLMGMFVTMLATPTLGIIFGLVVGLSFALFVEGFVSLRGLDYHGADPCHPGERVFEQGPARHLDVRSSIRGWLFLTNGRLIFRSLDFERDGHERSIPLEDIVEIQAFPINWSMSSGLLVVTTQGEERFAVGDNAFWVGMISRVKIGLANAIWNSDEAGSHIMPAGGGHAGDKDDRIVEHPGKPADTPPREQIKTGTKEP